jgi:hypothetical protein
MSYPSAITMLSSRSGLAGGLGDLKEPERPGLMSEDGRRALSGKEGSLDMSVVASVDGRTDRSASSVDCC